MATNPLALHDAESHNEAYPDCRAGQPRRPRAAANLAERGQKNVADPGAEWTQYGVGWMDAKPSVARPTRARRADEQLAESRGQCLQAAVEVAPARRPPDREASPRSAHQILRGRDGLKQKRPQRFPA